MKRAAGPDVSHHRPVVDWDALLANDVDFLGVKATEGVGYVDPWFTRHRDGARAAGDRLVAVVYYHFARPGSARDQAHHFVDSLVELQPNERLALDVEGPDAEALAWCGPEWIADYFAALAEAAPDRRHALYSSDRVWRLLGEPKYPGAADVDLWLPRYSAWEPVVPKPWRDAGRTWTIWQWSESANVPGVMGRCDMNYFNGDADALRRWASPRPPAPATDGGLPPSPF